MEDEVIRSQVSLRPMPTEAELSTVVIRSEFILLQERGGVTSVSSPVSARCDDSEMEERSFRPTTVCQ